MKQNKKYISDLRIDEERIKFDKHVMMLNEEVDALLEREIAEREQFDKFTIKDAVIFGTMSLIFVLVLIFGL